MFGYHRFILKFKGPDGVLKTFTSPIVDDMERSRYPRRIAREVADRALSAGMKKEDFLSASWTEELPSEPA
jgi:hypothetical protein